MNSFTRSGPSAYGRRAQRARRRCAAPPQQAAPSRCANGRIRCNNNRAAARAAAAQAAAATTTPPCPPGVSPGTQPATPRSACCQSPSAQFYGVVERTPVYTVCCDACRGCVEYPAAQRDPYWPTFAHPRWMSCRSLYSASAASSGRRTRRPVAADNRG